MIFSTNRRSFSGSALAILTRLWRDVSPEMISTADLGTSSRSARNSRHSLLAAPSTGGDVSLILRALPCTPHNSFFDARGWTWRFRTIPPSVRLQRVGSGRLIAGKHTGMTVQQGLETHLELDFLPADIFDTVSYTHLRAHE